MKPKIIERATREGRTSGQAEAIAQLVIERDAKQAIPLSRLLESQPDTFTELLNAEFAAVRRSRPDLFREVPANETVLGAIAARHAQAFGTPLSGESKLTAFREIAAMTDDEKLAAVGDYVPPAPTAAPTAPARPATAVQKLLKPAREITLAEMESAISAGYSGDITGLPVSKKIAIYEGLRAMQPKSDDTAQTLDKLAGIRALTPQERLNRHRAGG